MGHEGWCHLQKHFEDQYRREEEGKKMMRGSFGKGWRCRWKRTSADFGINFSG